MWDLKYDTNELIYKTERDSTASLLFSHKCTVEFSRSFMICDHVITLAANGVCACVFLGFLEFSKTIQDR